VRENLKGFGQSTAELEKIKQLLFVDCYASTAKTKSVEEYSVSQPFSLPDLGITLSEATGEIGKSPLVILDSIVPLLAHIDPSKVLDFLQDRSARIKGLNGVFVVSIGEETIDQKLMNRLEETVDCLIEVDMVENKGASLRQLRVRKMRGRKASDAIIQFTINPEKGIVFSV
jgi:archaellum biogenesis ATPase FlaH